LRIILGGSTPGITPLGTAQPDLTMMVGCHGQE